MNTVAIVAFNMDVKHLIHRRGCFVKKLCELILDLFVRHHSSNAVVIAESSKGVIGNNIQSLLRLKNVPSCMTHGIRLYSELMGLKRKFDNLEAIANSFSG